MKNRLFGVSFIILLFTLISCNSNSTKNLDEKINDTEGLLFDEFGQFNKIVAEQLVQLYVKRVDSLPRDSLTADYLFKAADVSVNLGNSSRTIILLNRFSRDFPKHEQAPISIFLKAFVYETQMNDTAQARLAYEEFLFRYPQSDFAEDARSAIANLGKSPEDLIREFESLNKQ
jgi:outer membrane protein assembly factor BamD (BamD/ComL family)